MPKSRLVIFKIPVNISSQNLEDTLMVQYPDISLNNSDIETKFYYTTKTEEKFFMEERAHTC